MAGWLGGEATLGESNGEGWVLVWDAMVNGRRLFGGREGMCVLLWGAREWMCALSAWAGKSSP